MQFVPNELAQYVATLPDNGAPAELPGRIARDGAVLFCDAAGFSRTAERLAARGPSGIEQLSLHLNAFFGGIVSIIAAHGGDVVAFAGDAVIAAWLSPTATSLAKTKAAVACALEIQARSVRLNEDAVVAEAAPHILGGESLGSSLAAGGSSESVHLPLRASIANGAVDFLMVGGSSQAFAVATGPGVAAAAALDAVCPLHKVAVCARSRQLLAEIAELSDLADGAAQVDAFPQDSSPVALEPVALLTGQQAALTQFVNASARAASHPEMRKVTVCFINVGAPSGSLSLDALQNAVGAALRVVERYGGVCNKILQDDKGSSLLVVFGIPPSTYTDNARRAVLTALDVHEAVSKVLREAMVSIGVSSGRSFAGLFGSADRQEYAVLSRTVNLGARLMQHAQGRVICEEVTRGILKGSFEFQMVGEVAVKGFDAPVRFYTPTKAAQPAPVLDRRQMVGRTRELETLEAALDKLAGGGGRSIVWLEAVAGAGKSTLVRGFLEAAAQRPGIARFHALAGAFEKNTPLFAWRAALGALFGVDDTASPVETRERIEAVVGAHPDQNLLKPVMPLLNDIDPELDIPESPLTMQLSGQSRADRLAYLVTCVVAQRRPCVLVLDDAHWADTASWNLLRSVLMVCTTGIVALVSTRPLAAGVVAAPAAAQIREMGTRELLLPAMSDAEIGELLRHRLHAETVAPDLLSSIVSKAEGLAFFAEELVASLLDGDKILVEQGVARFAPDVKDGSIDWPGSLEDTITARLSELAPAEQLTAKVASVLGRTFVLEDLRAVHPEREDADLVGHLSKLERLDLTLVEDQERLVVSFKHALTRDTAYALMLSAQRKELHLAVARHYEHRGKGASLLAFHYSAAGDLERTYLHSAAAADAALSSYALEEAIGFATAALAILEGRADRRELHRQRERDRFLFIIGSARYSLGDLRGAEMVLVESVHRTMRLPATKAGYVSFFFRQLFRQWRHLKQPDTFPTPTCRVGADELSDIGQCANAIRSLSQIHYLQSSKLKSVSDNLFNVNELEARVGHCKELAQVYCSLAMVAGFARKPALAAKYLARAHGMLGEPGIDDILTRGIVNSFSVGTAAFVGNMDETTTRMGREALKAFDTLGDQQRWTEAATMLQLNSWQVGAFASGIDLGRELERRARARGDLYAIAVGAMQAVFSLAHIVGTDGAAECLAMANHAEAAFGAAAGKNVDLNVLPLVLAAKARALYITGDSAAAAAALARVEEILPLAFTSPRGPLCLFLSMETALLLRDDGHDDPRLRTLVKRFGKKRMLISKSYAGLAPRMLLLAGIVGKSPALLRQVESHPGTNPYDTGVAQAWLARWQGEPLAEPLAESLDRRWMIKVV